MNTVIARVLRVLTGDSSAAMVHALDEHGREHKLEIPAAAARTVTPGRLLILQWSVHDAPNAITEAPPTVPPTVPPAATGNQASTTEPPAIVQRDANRQLAELLGIRLADKSRDT